MNNLHIDVKTVYVACPAESEVSTFLKINFFFLFFKNNYRNFFLHNIIHSTNIFRRSFRSIQYTFRTVTRVFPP